MTNINGLDVEIRYVVQWLDVEDESWKDLLSSLALSSAQTCMAAYMDEDPQRHHRVVRRTTIEEAME